MYCDDWGDWEEWQQLRELDWKLSDLKSAGAYMIAAKTPIDRLKGRDEHGILTIGKASVLRARIGSFWNGVKGHATSSTIVTGHMAGVRFQMYGLREHFPLDELRVSWISLPDADAAADEEAFRLDKYIQQHLEPPPLNYCVPRAGYFRRSSSNRSSG